MTGRRLAVLATLLLTAGTTLGTLTAAAQEGEPRLTLDLTGAKAGETVLVQGTGWEGTDLVYVELCGNGGRTGTSSCDQSGATLAGVGSEGSFGATVTVAKPPLPCPCVIKATSQTTRATATAPLAVQDVPVVALENQAESTALERSVDITEARLTGRGPWSSWFGQAAERTLVVTVVNTGEVAVHDPPLTITVGKGSNPSGVVQAPDLGTLEPGDSVTVEVPVRLGPIAFGEHSAKVSVAGFAEPIEATATNTTYPWALLAIAAVVLQLGLLKLRNMAHRRYLDAEAEHEASEILELPAPAPLMLVAASGGATLEPPLPAAAIPLEAGLASPDDATDEPADDDDLDVGTPLPAAADVAAASRTDQRPAVDDDVPDAGTEPAEPVVIDLREPPPEPEPEAEPGVAEPVTEPASPDPDHHLPNPFDDASAALVAGPVAVASRRRNEAHSVRAEVEAERQAAHRALEEAQAHATSILARAAARAEESAAEAEATRAEAAATLDDARRRGEHLLAEAQADALLIRQGADEIHDTMQKASIASQAEVQRMTTEAAREIDERLAAAERAGAELMARAAERRPTPVADATPKNGASATNGHRAVEHRGAAARPSSTASGLDAAIQRAVHRAFQG